MNLVNSLELSVHQATHIELGPLELRATDGGRLFGIRHLAIHTAQGEAIQLILYGEPGGIGLIEHHAAESAGAAA